MQTKIKVNVISPLAKYLTKKKASRSIVLLFHSTLRAPFSGLKIYKFWTWIYKQITNRKKSLRRQSAKKENGRNRWIGTEVARVSLHAVHFLLEKKYDVCHPPRYLPRMRLGRWLFRVWIYLRLYWPADAVGGRFLEGDGSSCRRYRSRSWHRKLWAFVPSEGG